MTTYAITAPIESFDNQTFVTELTYADFLISMQDGDAFQYSYAPGVEAGTPIVVSDDPAEDNSELVIVTLTNAPLGLAVDSPDTPGAILQDHPLSLADLMSAVFDVDWDGGTKRTTVLALGEVFFGTNPLPPDTDALIVLAGDALPTFASEAAATAFFEQADLFTVHDTSLAAPGTLIDLASIAASVTEDDIIVDTSDLGRTLEAGVGDDDISGLDGDDTIDGGAGYDTARYDLDADYGATGGISANMGAGTVNDAFGDTDTLISIERIIGTARNDSVLQGNSDIHFYGGDAPDLFFASTGSGFFDGGDSIDLLTYTFAGAGVVVDISRGVAKGPATGRDAFVNVEQFVGSSHDDFFVQREGTLSSISALAGNDVIRLKNEASAELYGGEGDDKLVGGEADDVMFGGADNDALIGNGGIDELSGEAGIDYIYGGRGDDILEGGDDNDFLRGNRGEDILNGGSGDDDLEGGADSDLLFGEDGDDVLEGGNGNDRLSGGSGSDYHFGGSGADVFAFSDADTPGFDRIQDFEDGTDLIDLSGFGYTSTADFSITSPSAGRVLLTLDAGQRVNIAGVELADITDADFLF